MKKIFLLATLVILLSTSSICAQVFSTQKRDGAEALKNSQAEYEKSESSINSSEKAKKSMNVVKQFKEKAEENKYDNSQRKVFSIKMVNGKIVTDDNAPRSILVSYGNYQVNRSFDSLTRCTIRIYVLNDLMQRITNFSFKLHWPKVSTTVQMNRLNPGVKTYKDIMLLGDGCFNLDKVPTIEVNRCRVKGMSQEDCANAVIWYQGRKHN